MSKSRGDGRPVSKATEQFEAGMAKVRAFPLLQRLLHHSSVYRRKDGPYPREGWAVVTHTGSIYVHPERSASAEEWVYVVAHCLLHMGFGHLQPRYQQREWDLACDCVVWSFLARLKFGRAPESLQGLPDLGSPELPGRTEEVLFRHFCERGIPESLPSYSLTGTSFSDMVEGTERRGYYTVTAKERKLAWENAFAYGLVEAVTEAVDTAGGRTAGEGRRKTVAGRAREWFINRYPLLGALAASFALIEDPGICARMEISVAAVNDYTKEIYVNPGAGLTEESCRFVMAHELLHVALRHTTRRKSRDPYLWNVACDFVINEWLIEMKIGSVPPLGLLHDPEVKGLSAESIYDRIVTDLRRYRRLGTFRGVGLGDLLDGPPGCWDSADGTDLDAFYRGCLAQGLLYHGEQGRGLLPAGLVEEIRALSQPPIPWDVQLARWFDEHFPPVEQKRSYARQSRRQSSTPDIPRPRYVPDPVAQEARTFGVVLDTSGSMSRWLLGESLGAIASYCESRDVYSARVIFCDASAYDAGYMRPEEIAGRVQVRGRGGTILQPGIDLLEKAEDFPKDGPILVITDGMCDVFETRRDHAILLPEGRSLPFVPRGKLFRMSAAVRPSYLLGTPN